MRIRRAVTMATVGAASAASLVLSAGAASAFPVGMGIYKGGALKAYGSYDRATRMACVQGYNNPAGARQQWDFWADGNVQGIAMPGNHGGCRQLETQGGYWSGRAVWVTLTHVGSGGQETVKGDWVLL